MGLIWVHFEIQVKYMIIDVTGIVLTPGNGGKDCLGDGEHTDEKGNRIECCCDECDYLQDCWKAEKEKSAEKNSGTVAVPLFKLD